MCFFGDERARLLCPRSKGEVQLPRSGCKVQAADPEHQPDAGAQLQVSLGWVTQVSRDKRRAVLFRRLVPLRSVGGEYSSLLPVAHIFPAFNIF